MNVKNILIMKKLIKEIMSDVLCVCIIIIIQIILHLFLIGDRIIKKIKRWNLE